LSTLYTGTSGYSYQDWRDNFYPGKLQPSQYLKYYSSFFNTVEINFTYYRFPDANILRSMGKIIEGQSDFIFSIKANHIFTHERNYSENEAEDFIKALEPLKSEKRLGSIPLQFPYSFGFNNNNLLYLSKLLGNFENIEKCVEFRNRNWINEKTIQCLESSGTGFCNVDEPNLKGLMPPTSLSTTESAYIRFHGRNAANWWNPRYAYQRYDYMYRQEELAEWLPRVSEIRKKSKKLLVYFNNHYKGKAVKSALMFIDLLNRSA